MKIKKLGQCCLVIETQKNGTVKRILTDPGNYSDTQNEEKNIDLILITHEHADHFHIESVKKILANNPEVKIITNTAVGRLLQAEGIAYTILEDGGSEMVAEVLIEGYGERHAEIYEEFGQVQNTGYFVENILFYPGDAFTDPKKPVDILALPVAGPWMKISEAIRYALALKPRVVFPVHDAIMKSPAMMQGMVSKILPEHGVDFVPMDADDEREF